MSHDPAGYSSPGRAGGVGAIPRDRPEAGDAGRGPAGGPAAAGAGVGGTGAPPPRSPIRRFGPDTERDGRPALRPATGPAPAERCPAPRDARCRTPPCQVAARGMISIRSAVVLGGGPCALTEPCSPCSPAARSSPAHHPIRRARSRGLCHQEASQEDGQEEAPQAAAQDPRPASSSRQVTPRGGGRGWRLRPRPGW